MRDDEKGLPSLFMRAIEIDTLKERQEFLNKEFAHDQDLRDELVRLIHSYESAGDFLESPIRREGSSDAAKNS